LKQAGRFDASTDDYNFRNRDYSPALGRWVENDPLGFGGGQTNLYGAEGDNPTNNTDPTGTDWNDVINLWKFRGDAWEAIKERGFPNVMEGGKAFLIEGSLTLQDLMALNGKAMAGAVGIQRDYEPHADWLKAIKYSRNRTEATAYFAAKTGRGVVMLGSDNIVDSINYFNQTQDADGASRMLAGGATGNLAAAGTLKLLPAARGSISAKVAREPIILNTERVDRILASALSRRGQFVPPELQVTRVLTKAVAPRGPTLPNTTRGWRVGDPINNLTSTGRVPSWSAVRQRFWKNEAALNPGNYSQANLARTQRGLAPQRINPRTGQLESMELHHTPPQRNGGLFDVQPVWQDDHALIDPFRITGN